MHVMHSVQSRMQRQKQTQQATELTSQEIEMLQTQVQLPNSIFPKQATAGVRKTVSCVIQSPRPIYHVIIEAQ